MYPIGLNPVHYNKDYFLLEDSSNEILWVPPDDDDDGDGDGDWGKAWQFWRRSLGGIYQGPFLNRNAITKNFQIHNLQRNPPSIKFPKLSRVNSKIPDQVIYSKNVTILFTISHQMTSLFLIIFRIIFYKFVKVKFSHVKLIMVNHNNF